MSREQERVSSPWCYGKIPVSVWNAAEPYTQLLEKFAEAAFKSLSRRENRAYPIDIVVDILQNDTHSKQKMDRFEGVNQCVV